MFFCTIYQRPGMWMQSGGMTRSADLCGEQRVFVWSFAEAVHWPTIWAVVIRQTMISGQLAAEEKSISISTPRPWMFHQLCHSRFLQNELVSVGGSCSAAGTTYFLLCVLYHKSYSDGEEGRVRGTSYRFSFHLSQWFPRWQIQAQKQDGQNKS